MQPDVTFVIAAYNAEATLDRAIASAIAQRDVTVEVIVVDDKSSDMTLDVARSFPEDVVRVVALGQNRGPGGARNAGLDAGARPLDCGARFRRRRLSRTDPRHDRACGNGGRRDRRRQSAGRARGRHSRGDDVPSRTIWQAWAKSGWPTTSPAM